MFLRHSHKSLMNVGKLLSFSNKMSHVRYYGAYDVLGIQAIASQKEIKSAYRKLAKLHHPDAGGNHFKFIEISNAYHALINPEKKAKYDLS